MRFPEFDGAWRETRLGDIAEKINSGKTPLGGEAVYAPEGILFIRSQNVNNDKLDLTNSVFIPEEVNESMKNSVVKPNDILLNITGASLGRSCVVPENFKIGNVNQHVCIIRLLKQYNPRFIQPMLASARGQNIFLSLQTGSGREGLNFESIKKIKVSFPNKEEQDTIAHFITQIQDRIDTQNKIIQRLESLIKVLIDSLIKKAVALDSSVVTLSEIGSSFSGLSGKTKEHFGSGKKYIQYKQVFDSSKININNFDLVQVEESENQCKAKFGDVFFTISSETPSEIGMSSVLLEEVDEVYLNSFCFGFRPNSFEWTNPHFLRFYFRSAIFRNELQKLAQGSTRYNMSKTAFLKLRIALPGIKSQEVIAKALTAIDAKIEIEKSILQNLVEQKTYFLSKVFI